MALIIKNGDELNTDTVSRLVGLGYTDAKYKGTAVRDIVESADIHIADLYSAMSSNLTTQYLSQAKSDALDALGLLVGITRRNGESDQNLRVRIGNAIQASSGANLLALTQALLGLANVRDVIAKPFTHGIGSLSFYLIGIAGIPDATTIALAQQSIDSMAAGGAYSVVTVPQALLINITGSIATNNSLTLQTLQSQAQLAIANYINNLSMGDTFIFDKIIQAVLDASPNITDFTVATISTTNTSGATVEQLVSNYTPLFDQELQPGAILIQ
jgi:hypothetical protein